MRHEITEPKRYTGLIIPGPSDKYLALFHVKRNEWRFGGGKIESGEVPLACAAREAFEEFDITITAMHFQEAVAHNADGSYWCGYWFVVDKYEGCPRIKEPKKHTEMRWLSLNELKQFHAHPEFQVAYHHARQTRHDFWNFKNDSFTVNGE